MSERHLVSGNSALNGCGYVIRSFIYLFSASDPNSINLKLRMHTDTTHTHTPIKHAVTHLNSLQSTSKQHTGHVAELSLSGPTLLSLLQPQSSDLGFK